MYVYVMDKNRKIYLFALIKRNELNALAANEYGVWNLIHSREFKKRKVKIELFAYIKSNQNNIVHVYKFGALFR